MLDLAVPRNIDPKIAHLPDCYLYSVDDLQDIIFESIEQRQEAAKIAEEMLERAVEKFFTQQKITNYGEEIKKFTEKVDEMITHFVEEATQSVQLKDAVLLGKKLAKRIQHEALVLLKESGVPLT